MDSAQLLCLAEVASAPLPDAGHPQYGTLLAAKANAEIERRALRERAEASLYVFTQDVLGYRDLHAPLHRPLYVFPARGPERKRPSQLAFVAESARSSSKTRWATNSPRCSTWAGRPMTRAISASVAFLFRSRPPPILVPLGGQQQAHYECLPNSPLRHCPTYDIGVTR